MLGQNQGSGCPTLPGLVSIYGHHQNESLVLINFSKENKKMACMPQPYIYVYIYIYLVVMGIGSSLV